MSFNHHHHHHPRPYVEEDYCEEVYDCERVYAAPPPASYLNSECAYERGYYERPAGGYAHHNNGGNYQRNERLGELGALAAGAFALYEGHKAKTDPEHASKHKIEGGTSALGALGSAGYALYEHRQKNKSQDGRW